MILAKLIATLEIRKIAAAARVSASSQRTPLSTASIMIRPLLRSRRTFQRREAPALSCLPRALCRLREHLIRRVELRLCTRYVLADARERLEHCRLLIHRQADQFAAAVQPSLACPLVDLDYLRID